MSISNTTRLSNGLDRTYVKPWPDYPVFLGTGLLDPNDANPGRAEKFAEIEGRLRMAREDPLRAGSWLFYCSAKKWPKLFCSWLKEHFEASDFEFKPHGLRG